MAPEPEFFEPLKVTLDREFDDFRDLLAVDRLSGGASMETYRISIQTSSGPQLLCMRRGAGGIDRESVSAVGLRTEALLMRTAKESGVVEPDIYYELEPDDGVGVGFIMEWLGGETLGSRVNCRAHSSIWAGLTSSAAAATLCGKKRSLGAPAGASSAAAVLAS